MNYIEVLNFKIKNKKIICDVDRFTFALNKNITLKIDNIGIQLQLHALDRPALYLWSKDNHYYKEYVIGGKYIGESFFPLEGEKRRCCYKTIATKKQLFNKLKIEKIKYIIKNDRN